MMDTILESLRTGFDVADWGGCPASLPLGAAGYVYFLLVHCEGRRYPLYVGETNGLADRAGHYKYAGFRPKGRTGEEGYANFGAPTDFKVGEALRYLINMRQCRIDLHYRASEFQLQDEHHLIRELQFAGFHLLNTLSGFKSKTAVKEDERKAIHRFCDMTLRQAHAWSA
jgi:hypothetical protein